MEGYCHGTLCACRVCVGWQQTSPTAQFRRGLPLGPAAARRISLNVCVTAPRVPASQLCHATPCSPTAKAPAVPTVPPPSLCYPRPTTPTPRTLPAGVKLMQQLHSGASPADVSLPGRPPALEALLRWMLQPEPEQRPSAAQILQYISSQGGVLLAEASAAMNTGMVAGMDAGMQPTTAQDGAAAGWSQEDGQGCVAREAASPANKTTPTPAASPSVATLFGIASLAASPFASVGCAYGQEQGDESAGCGVPPCPFGELSQESSGEEVVGGSAAPMPQHAQQAQQAQQHQPFSFAPLPLQPAASASPGRLPAPGSFAEEDGGSAAATPVAPRPLGRFGGRGGLSAAARRAAAAAGGLQRWVPSLSPLVSEGALTPGALEGLSQPSAVKPGLFRSMGRDLSVVIPSSAAHAMPSSSDTPDEASPMLSPGAGGLGSGGGGGSGSQPRHIRLQHRNSTDSKDGWRLSRRDMISPDSDALARGWSSRCLPA